MHVAVTGHSGMRCPCTVPLSAPMRLFVVGRAPVSAASLTGLDGGPHAQQPSRRRACARLLLRAGASPTSSRASLTRRAASCSTTWPSWSCGTSRRTLRCSCASTPTRASAPRTAACGARSTALTTAWRWWTRAPPPPGACCTSTAPAASCWVRPAREGLPRQQGVHCARLPWGLLNSPVAGCAQSFCVGSFAAPHRSTPARPGGRPIHCSLDALAARLMLCGPAASPQPVAAAFTT